MAPTHDPRAILLGLAGEYRHLRAEHRRASPHSSARRRLETEMAAVAERIERRLGDCGLKGDDIEAWRHHVHHGGAPPARPEPAPAPPQGEPPPDRPSGSRPWPR